MNKMSFDGSIEKIKILFTYNGLTMNSKHIDVKKKWKLRFLFVFNMIWFNSDAIGGIAWMVLRLRDGGTIGEVTYMAPCATLTYLSAFKGILMLYYEDDICDLVMNLRELDLKYNKNRPEVKSDVDFLHFILRASKILNAMLCIVFSWSTLVVSLIFYVKDGVFEIIYPLKVEYPFNHQDAKVWPFVYVHQFWSVCLVVFNILCSDYLLYVFCTYLRVQYRLLRCDFQTTIDENCQLPQKSFEDKCMPLIKWHQTLIELSQKLEFVYTKSTLGNFVSSSILICLTGFNVVTMNNAAVSVMFLVFLSANLAQIYLLCYFGDLLMRSSMEVSEAIYNSKWYELDSKTAKCLLIVHYRSQKPCKLTAFGFSDVNLKSFMSILSSSWSYFALLKTVTSPTKN